MIGTPKSLRLQIALVGRVNSGKSSFLNLVSGQQVAITSSQRGTTTDVVEKAQELIPLGPVLWLDTAGTDDDSALGKKRGERTLQAVDRADIMLIVTTPNVWGEPEAKLLKLARERDIPAIPVVNRIDTAKCEEGFLATLKEKCGCAPITANSLGGDAERDRVLDAVKSALLASAPDDFLTPPPMLGDLLAKPGALVILIVPIDIQAPKGRLILPQVQAIRDALDADAQVLVVKENQYSAALANLKNPPALVVCDSQVVDKMVAETPETIPCTTFSILLSRLKGDIVRLAAGVNAIRDLRSGDRVLMAEACTHHATHEDIGRVKIPRMLEKRAGGKLEFDFSGGRDFPEDLSPYKLIVHCGSCMLNRRETLRRLERAGKTPVTNYGMAISYCRGVLKRVLSPFPDALKEVE